MKSKGAYGLAVVQIYPEAAFRSVSFNHEFLVFNIYITGKLY